VDVALELRDSDLVIGDDVVEDVAHRDHAEHGGAVEHRQVADAPFAHQRHALARRRARADDNDLARHDLAHQGGLRVAPLQGDLARVVALGEHTDELAALDHHQRPDLVLGKHLQRAEDGFVGMHVPERAVTLAQQFGDRLHRVTPSQRWPPTLLA